MDEIIAVTVTYGNRWDYLEKCIESLQKIDLIKKVIVVNNGSTYDINEKIKKYLKVSVLNLNDNTGSANGFHEGIKAYQTYASKSRNPLNHWLLLLDDDNYISDFNEISIKRRLKNIEDNNILFANRTSRQDYFKSYKKVRDNCFLGFNLFKSKPVIKTNTYELLPYSGMLIPYEISLEIGLPNRSYYLYCDDYEYSFRLAKNGIHTSLIGDLKLEDSEDSWNQINENYAITLADGNPLKIYYSVRNRVHFELENLTTSKFRFTFNGLLFFVYFFYKNFRYRKRIKYQSFKALIIGAIDGKRNKLGIHSKYKLR